MSSSVFKEYQSSSSSGTDENLKVDSNLVIVVNKDGSVSVDQKTLHWVLANETTNTSVSVVRVSSPTPSIEEEIEKEKKLKLAKMEGNRSEEMESLNVSNSSLEEDVPHVSLTVEGYYPPDEARMFAAEVLSLAGLQSPLKIETIDYEFQKLVILNDHCYTPLTSPSQRLPARSQFDDDISNTESSKSAEATETPPESRKRVVKAPTTSTSKAKKIPSSENETDEEESELQGMEDSDSDYTEESTTSSEGDRDSDLDFSVTPRTRKGARKTGRGGNRAILKAGRPPKKRPSASTSNVTDNDVENMLREIENAHSSKEASFSFKGKKVAKTAKKSGLPKTPAATKTKKETKPIVKIPPPVQSVAETAVPSTSTAPDLVPETAPVIIKKVDKKPPAHVEALFSDMSSLFSAPDIIKKVGSKSEVSPPSSSPAPSTSTTVKGFVQLALTKNQKQLGGGQISIQMHTSVSEFDNSLLSPPVVRPDPKEVREVQYQHTSMLTNVINTVNTPEAKSNPNVLPLVEQANMLSDDGLPEDLLQHVAELAENKELQEIIDKQVLGVINSSAADLNQSGNESMVVMPQQNTIQPIQPQPSVVKRVSPPTMSVKEQLMPRKQAIQIRRSDGRIITLPPIEAPATRGAKRRAQGNTTSAPTTPAAKMPAAKVVTPVATVTETGTLVIDESKSTSRRNSLQKSLDSASSKEGGRTRRNTSTNPAVLAVLQTDDDIDSDESWNSEDDPDRLWCICKQPHNNRFMICCDSCEDWFHGKCVNITKTMGQEMEEDGIEWTCPNCLHKKEEKILKQQTKLTDYIVTTKVATPTTSKQIIQAPASASSSSTTTGCIVCKRAARTSSIYCSDDCIRQHAHNALNPTKTVEQNDKKETKILPIKDSKHDTVIVYERKTGRCLAGKNAPTAENLKQWLQEHPTFEVVPQGSAQALAIRAKQLQLRQLQKDMTAKKHQESNTPPVKSVQTTIKINDQKKIMIVAPSQSSKVLQKSTPTVTATSSKTPQSKPAPVKQRKSLDSGKASTSKSSGPEPIRITVRKTFKEQLQIRMSEIVDKCSPRLSEAEIEQFVMDTEKEMFLLFNKDTGAKYRAKYRSLMFNIKDRKNLSLFQKICNKKIEPKQLVKLSPDELASQELAQWRENENKHQLEMIKKSELDLLACAKNYVLKTHKGEEVIESKDNERLQIDPTVSVEDVVSVLNNSTVSSTTEVEQSPTVKDMYRYDKVKDYDYLYGKSFANIPYGASSTPTTTSTSSSSSKKKETKRSRSRSHERSSRDHSKSSKHKRKHSRDRSRSREKDRHSGKDHKRDRSRERSRERKHDKKDKHHSKEHSSREKEKESIKTKITVMKMKEKDEAIRKSIESKKVKKEVKPKPETFNLIDQILEASSTLKPEKLADEKPEPSSVVKVEEKSFKTVALDQDQEPTSTVTIPTPPHSTAFDNKVLDFQSTPPLVEAESDVNLWTGNIHMVDVATVEISFERVSGDCSEIFKAFPEELDICGTIKPDLVWTYISQIKKSPNKEIVVIRLCSTELSAYYTLYSHLNSRKRLSVMSSSSPLIKDFYVLPLPAERDYPAILLPIKGPGIKEGEMKPDLLLGIIVKINGKRTATSSAGSSASKISRQSSKMPSLKSSSSSSSKIYSTKAESSSPSDSPKLSSNKPVSAQREIKSKLTVGLPKAVEEEIKEEEKVASSETLVIDDDDEPYSPEDSDESNFADVSEIVAPKVAAEKNKSKIDFSDTEKIKQEMDELNRKIAEEKSEIVGIIHKADLKEEELKNTLPSSLIDIAIPSNLSEILASIKHVGSSKSAQEITSTMPKVEDNDDDDDDEEYVPECPSSSLMGYKSAFSYTANLNNDIDERILHPMSTTTHAVAAAVPPVESTSKLANLTEAELLQMVPDEAVLAPGDKATIKIEEEEAAIKMEIKEEEEAEKVDEKAENENDPPAKKSRWDDAEPPPPGLEDEFNET